MKRFSIAALTVGVLILSSVAAGAGTQLKVKIPFAFHAGDVALPAGEYLFSMGWHSDLMVAKADGSDACIVPMLRERSSASGAYRVTFTKYGDEYFLSEVRDRDFQATVLKTRAEKTLAMNAARQPAIAAVIK